MFTSAKYKEDIYARNGTNSFQKMIEDKVQEAKTGLSVTDDIIANKVAKNISSIFLTNEEIEARANNSYNGDKNKVYNSMANKYKECIGKDKDSEGNNINTKWAENNLVLKKQLNGTISNSNKYYIYACVCYEYMQFKRGIFESDETKIQYDAVSGRVSHMIIKFKESIR